MYSFFVCNHVISILVFQISKKKAAEQMLDHLRSLPPLASYSNTEEEEEEEEEVKPVAAPQKAPARSSAQTGNGIKQKKAPPAAASNATKASPEAAVTERNSFS